MSIEELQEGHKKWIEDRNTQLRESEWRGGRDLRDQTELISAFMGAEQDIAYLMGLCGSLIQHIATHPKPKPHSQVGAGLASDKSDVRTEDKLRKGKP